MSGIKLIKWVEMEEPLATGGTARCLAEFKNDFQEVWIKNIRVAVQAIRNPAGQPCRGLITAAVLDSWQDCVMPQGVFGCHVQVITTKCPPGKYELEFKVEYDIASERMVTSAVIERPVDVVIP
jgi:hypothetical protein